MACPSCGRGLHFECEKSPCCCGGSISKNLAEHLDLEEEDDRGHPRRWQQDSSLKDQQSTGRKRAAKLYPLNPESPCEWRGLRFAGGGKFPIVGCITGRQQARHHGPDKNTLNNEGGNVHRICHTCHNRWHANNDSGYETRIQESGYGQAHDEITRAAPEDQAESEIYWASKRIRKVVD